MNRFDLFKNVNYKKIITIGTIMLSTAVSTVLITDIINKKSTTNTSCLSDRLNVDNFAIYHSFKNNFENSDVLSMLGGEKAPEISKEDFIAYQNKVNLEIVKDKAKNLIKTNEGLSLKPYRDSEGYWTIGYGHLISYGRQLPSRWNRRITVNEAEDIFETDFNYMLANAEKHPAWNLVDNNGKTALIDLAFNMGPFWHQQWKETTNYMVNGNMTVAINSLLNSRYARQVGYRARYATNLLKNSYVGDTEGRMASMDDQRFAAEVRSYITQYKDNDQLLGNLTYKIKDENTKNFVENEINRIEKSKNI
jgi:lysozyme